MTDARHVVLVHGAWHGAWCWAPLQAELDRRGIPSHAIELPGHGASVHPLGGLHHDASYVTDTLNHLSLDAAVLVGHSYGGAVITEAGAGRADLAHLVYIAAFALDIGESVNGALRSFERRSVALASAVQMQDDGTTTLNPDLAASALYGSCSPPAIEAALRRLSPQPVATMTESVHSSARDDISSSYLRCLRDEAVHPDHQTVMAARCDEQVDIDTDHSPFLSTTGVVADHLEQAACS
ncbi:MAG: alpha/beta hydrolase [Ilumatobacter sp.]|nr:alpha/beta hydrolase [Ilumatobacter sp.]